MELEEYKAIVEGVLFASGDEGLTRKKNRYPSRNKPKRIK